MKIFSLSKDLNKCDDTSLRVLEEKNKEVVLTLGSFDGIHLGHKSLIREVAKEAKKNNAYSLLVSFYPHPRIVLGKIENEFKLLTPFAEKEKLLEETGLDYLVIAHFTKDFSEKTPEEFYKYLTKFFKIKHLVVGYDHAFGKNRAGNFDFLDNISRLNNFSYSIVDKITIASEKKLSSSVIRNYLHQGEVERANRLLGYNYLIRGKVVHGKKIGRGLGYPTINFDDFNHNKLIPKAGVYLTSIEYQGKLYYSMSNIGRRPTFYDCTDINIETHIFDFNKNIYEEEINLRFLKFIRDEKKFSGKEELILQLQKDEKLCREEIKRIK